MQQQYTRHRKPIAHTYRFFFARPDLASFGICVLGCGRVDRAFRQRQLIRGRTMLHYSVIFVSRGEGFFESQHQPRVRIGANDGLLLFPEERHSYGCVSDKDWEEYWIAFDGQSVRQAHQEGLFVPEKPLFKPPDVQLVRDLFDACVAAANAQEATVQRRLPGLFHQILDEMLGGGAHATPSPATDALHAVRQAILTAPPAEHLDFRALAHQHGISYSLLRQRFRQTFGVGLTRYHNQTRMNLACTYLTQGHTVKETAILIGFDDPYYFSRLFRSSIGCPPSAFAVKLQP